MRILVSLPLIGLACMLGAPLATSAAEADRLREAAAVVRELRSAPDRGIPEELWQKADCVAVIPAMKKAAFVFGGEYGRGMMSCRTGNGWSAPLSSCSSRKGAGGCRSAPKRSISCCS